MLTTFIITVIGPDRSGLVKAVATPIAEHGGSWLESRMCRLGGQFAGILRVEVPADRADELGAALGELEGSGLKVTLLREDSTPAADENAVRVTLDAVGQDQPGILRRVTGSLAAHGLNIEDLSSERTDAPMGGGTLFKIRALLTLPAGVGLDRVRADLEAIAPDLIVELKPAI
ncbi:MAG: ACT domain-containing protein [Verrucomicrobiota bacterium]